MVRKRWFSQSAMEALKQPVISQTLLPLTLQVRTAYLTVKIVVRWLRGWEKIHLLEIVGLFLTISCSFSQSEKSVFGRFADLSDKGLNRSFQHCFTFCTTNFFHFHVSDLLNRALLSHSPLRAMKTGFSLKHKQHAGWVQKSLNVMNATCMQD